MKTLKKLRGWRRRPRNDDGPGATLHREKSEKGLKGGKSLKGERRNRAMNRGANC